MWRICRAVSASYRVASTVTPQHRQRLRWHAFLHTPKATRIVDPRNKAPRHVQPAQP